MLNWRATFLTVCFALSIFLYGPALPSFFVSDDFDWLARAKNIPLTVENYLLHNSDNNIGSGVYRPLTSFSFWLNYRLTGLDPLSYRTVNVVFHALNGFLLFLIICFFTDKKHLAALAGLFFIVFPNHAEAVSWISGRGDVLAVFFCLLSFLLYLNFRFRKKEGYLLLALLSFALALLSKESAMVLPAVVLSYELIWNFRAEKPKEWLKRILAPGISFLIILTVYFFLRWLSTGVFWGFYNGSALRWSVKDALENLSFSFWSHLLSAPWRQAAVLWSKNQWPFMAVFLAGVMAFCSALTFKFKEWRIWLWGIILFLIGAAPTLTLNFSRLTNEGERFAYFPSLGIAVALAAVFGSLIRTRNLKITGWLVAMAALIILGQGLWQKNLLWRHAGELNRSLLYSFGRLVDVGKEQGVVILGLPDNIEGAQVWRNGWLAALNIFYPNYSPDVLVVKTGLNLHSQNWREPMATWSTIPNGYRANGPSDLFFGQESVESLDYRLEIKNYSPKQFCGSPLEILFTPEFKNQLISKTIRFLRVDGLNLAEIKRF